MKVKREFYRFATFAFCLLPFYLSGGCALQPNRGGIPPQVQAAVDETTQRINDGLYDQIYTEAADEWKNSITLEESNETFKRLKSRLGSIKGRSFHTASEQDNSSGTPAGHSFIITYKATFDHGTGLETFTLVERDKRWLLARYFVSSEALR